MEVADSDGIYIVPKVQWSNLNGVFLLLNNNIIIYLHSRRFGFCCIVKDFARSVARDSYVMVRPNQV